MQKPKRCLVFDGGGLPGVKQVGFVEEAEERKIDWDMIMAVSVGALNGAKMVESGPKALKEYWLGVEKRGPYAVFPFSKLRIAKRIYDGERSFLPGDSLDRLVADLDIKKVLDSSIELRVVVKNESRNKTMVFSSRDPKIRENPERFRQIIKASASLPPIFPPVIIDGERFSDGYHFPLEECKDFNMVVVLSNDDPGLTGLVSGGDVWDRASLPQREIMDDFTPMAVENFLLKNPHFNKLTVSSGIERVQEWAEDVAKRFASIFRPEPAENQAKPEVPEYQLALVTPDYKIPSLRLHTFSPGDITKAINESRKQAKRELDKLFPETKSPS